MTLTLVRAADEMEIVRQDGPVRVRTGGPGLRGLAGAKGEPGADASISSISLAVSHGVLAERLLAKEQSGLAFDFAGQSALIRDIYGSTAYAGRVEGIAPVQRLSGGTYIDRYGVLQTAGNNAPRFSHDPATLAQLGVRLEGAATNQIVNSACAGAVAGTPGTMPTSWSVFGTSNGIASQVVGSGVEDGIPYVDVRFFGTPTASSALGVYTGINAGSGGGPLAAPNDTWTYSSAVRLVGGSLANLGFALWIWSLPGNQNYPPTAITPTGAALRTQRSSQTNVLNKGSELSVFTQIRSNYTLDKPVDVTLRIGIPQLEKAAQASSFITTTTAAATRAMDLISVPVTSIPYNPVESTLLVDCLVPGRSSATGSRALISIDAGDAAFNRILAYLQPGGSLGARVSGPANTAALNTWTPPDGLNVERIRLGISAKVGSAYIACNGASTPFPAPTEMPTGSLSLKLGNAQNNALPLNGTVKQAIYLPRQMSQAELVAWSAQS